MSRSKKQILAHIVTIGVNATNLQASIHAVGVECLEHAKEHGDVSLLQSLYQALPKGQRREALLKWAHTYTPIRVRGDNGERAGLLKETAKDYEGWDIEAAIANPYWDLCEKNGFKLDNEKISFEETIKAAVNGRLKRIDKAVEASNDANDPYLIDFDPAAARQELINGALALGITVKEATPSELIAAPQAA